MYFDIEADIIRINWGPGVLGRVPMRSQGGLPMGSQSGPLGTLRPWGPLGLGDPLALGYPWGLGDPGALGLIGPRGPIGPWGPIVPWGRGP